MTVRGNMMSGSVAMWVIDSFLPTHYFYNVILMAAKTEKSQVNCNVKTAFFLVKFIMNLMHVLNCFISLCTFLLINIKEVPIHHSVSSGKGKYKIMKISSRTVVKLRIA